ncbi:MAG: hypothetical protein JNM18_08520 [Planctomycetaceae bacterium]|nr:hypothetical protein [Planctomycetaceae bacterium]
MRSFSFFLFAITMVVSTTPGCSKSEVSAPSAEGTVFRLVKEPSGAKGVKAARADAKTDEEVTLVGRIGGDANPWVEGQAAFMLVDSALKPCGADEGCPTPWDYCCSTDELPSSKAMVKVVDAGGKTVATDARKLLGLKELQTVVIHGRAKRDDAGNLTVLADGVYVRN